MLGILTPDSRILAQLYRVKAVEGHYPVIVSPKQRLNNRS